jgi:hypothetical protein
MNERAEKALSVAGRLAGIAHELDADALENWLDNELRAPDQPNDFSYIGACRAAIAFKRAITQKAGSR